MVNTHQPAEPIVVAALYHFVDLPGFREFREPLLSTCLDLGLKGTLLLAEEGINGTVSGTRSGIDALLAFLRSQPGLAAIEWKESAHQDKPFYRMKVKLKKEIVTMGVSGIDPNRLVGRYVEPSDWNNLIADPDVLLVDTRNDYEYEIGTFEGAIDPKTTTFREFPAYVETQLAEHKNKKIAMFCTGGIRCEKASAYMLEQGFAEVYHLKGGILNYLEQVPEEDSLWRGECFVFDNRVAVNHRLEKGRYDQCHGCRHPITEQDKLHAQYQKGVCCHKCFDQLTPDQKERFAERQKQVELAKRRQEPHIGAAPPERQLRRVSLVHD